MILLDLHVDIDEEDEDIRVLRFDFTNNTRLTFECPTGLSALDALDAALTGNKKLIVGEYSYADVHWTAVAHFIDLAGKQSLIDSRVNVKAWHDKVKERPSYASLPSLDDIKQKQLKTA